MGDVTEQPAAAPASAPPPAPPAAPIRRSLSQIARDTLGSDYVGEVSPPRTTTPPPSDTEEGEAPIEEPEGESSIDEPKEEETRTAPAEETGETPIASVSELVEHLETNPEWFNGLKVAVQVDGTPTEATIGDLIKSYQITEAATNRLEDAKKYAQANTEAWVVKQQELEGRFQVLAELIKAEEATLERDVKAVDPSLRETDPAEWAARVTEFGHRRAHIDLMKANTVEQYKANAQARQKEFDTNQQTRQVEENKILLDKLPEWREPGKAEAEKVQIADYLLRAGFTAPELSTLIDHRQVLLARKAMLYDQSRGQVNAAKKLVAKVPKVMKPGAPKPTEQRAAEKLQALKSKLEKSGSIEDAVAYRMAQRGARR